MNTTTTRSGWGRPATVKAAAAFGLAMAMGVVSTTPAFGDDRNHHRDQNQNQNQNQNHGNQHASSRQGHNGNWQGDQRYDHSRDYRGYRDYRGNYYDNQRYVYAPPPVAYVPQPAPGISLFIPLQIR